MPAVDKNHRRLARGGQRTSNLKNEMGIGVALCVKRESAGQLGRRRKAIDSRREGLSTQILSRENAAAGVCGCACPDFQAGSVLSSDSRCEVVGKGQTVKSVAGVAVGDGQSQRGGVGDAVDD